MRHDWESNYQTLFTTEVAKVDLAGKTRIDLIVGCDDEDEEAVEVPTITVEL